MCVSLLVCICTTCMDCPQNPEEGIVSLGTEVTDSCELLRRYWELNSGSLQEQQMLSPTETSHQPQGLAFEKLPFCKEFKYNHLQAIRQKERKKKKNINDKDFGVSECDWGDLELLTTCVWQIRLIYPWSSNIDSCKIVTNNIYIAGLLPLLKSISTDFLGQYKQKIIVIVTSGTIIIPNFCITIHLPPFHYLVYGTEYFLNVM